MSEFERWLAQDLDDKDLTAELESVKGQPEEINDRFYRDLEFGTGGLRGVIGAGTNRMNVYTVRKATQGMANYLLAHADGRPQSVAIAHDSRNKGIAFAQQSAAVLAANGIKAYLYPQLMPTPRASASPPAITLPSTTATRPTALTAARSPPTWPTVL